jgi:hypothetical protein
VSTHHEPPAGGSASGWEADVLRRLEAELYAEPGQARRLRRYTAALAGNTSGIPPPTWRQLLACGLLLVLDAAVLTVGVSLDSAPLLVLALALFVASAAPFFIKPRWQRRPRSGRGRHRRRRPPPQ